jgi:hypothetical protein
MREAAAHGLEWLSTLTADGPTFTHAMRLLCHVGLAEADAVSPDSEDSEQRGYSMHGCVHLWTACVLNQEWNMDWVRVALTCVAKHVPSTGSPYY